MNGIPKAIKKRESEEIVFFNSKRKKEQDNKPSKKQIEKSSNIDKIPKLNDENKIDSEEEGNNSISLKQAKFDVFKYGIKGFNKEEQENAKTQLAIKLGAKPPKNKYMNYKEMLNAKKEEQKKKEELIKENRLFEAKVLSSKLNANKTKKSMNSQRKAKISKGHVGNIKGHIGSFSNGVLKINKRDLKNIGLK